MCGPRAHCRLCAEPSPRLVGVDDEVGVNCELKQKMLLVNVDVSAPSPLPRAVCYSCLCLLEKTATFLHQVNAAQDKLLQIYQDNEDLSERTDYVVVDFDFAVKKEPQDDEEVEIEIKPLRNELPEEKRSTEIIDIAEQQKKKRPKEESMLNNKAQKCEIETKPLKTAIKMENNTQPSRKSKRKPKKQANMREGTPLSEQGDKKKVKKRKHICECGSAWKTPFELKKHQKIHTQRTLEYSCHICGKAYISKGSLYNHMKTKHKPKQFKCEQCGMTFHEAYPLKMHATKHSSERPFACDKCDKTFRQKRHLVSHSVTHSDLRPHICSYCDKAFRLRKSLVVHIRLHTGLKPYCCEHCGRDFYDHSNHSKHVRTAHGADPRKKNKVDTESKSGVIGEDEIADQQ